MKWCITNTTWLSCRCCWDLGYLLILQKFYGQLSYLSTYKQMKVFCNMVVLALKLLSLPKSFYAALRHLHVLSLLLHHIYKSFWWNRWSVLVWSLFIESPRILSVFCSGKPMNTKWLQVQSLIIIIKENRKKYHQHGGCWESQDVMKKTVIHVTFCVLLSVRERRPKFRSC